MADQHSTLQAYISRLLDMKDGFSQREPLSLEELKNVALEMGLSEAQWQRMLDEFEDHITRGIGHAKFQNWDDSILELKKALEINPFSLRALLQTAKSYAARWERKGDKEDREKALDFAGKCLAQQPDHGEALELISKLKNTERVTASDIIGSSESRPLVIGAVTILLVFSFAMIAFLSLDDKPAEKQEEITNEQPETFEIPLGIPVNFIQNEKSQHLTLVPQSSETNSFTESFSYKFKGYLEVEKLEVSEIELKYELVNNEGEVLFSKVADALGGHEPTHFDGDMIGLGMNYFEKVVLPEDLSAVNISIEKIVAVPGQKITTEYPPVEVIWEQTQPANIDLSVRERLSKESKGLSGGTFQKLNWEVENTGQLSLKSAKAQIVWYDENGQELGRKDTWLLANSDPVLNAGQTILAGGTYGMKEIEPGQANSYKISLVQVDF